LQLTILKIILWPKNTDLRPRVIPFQPGKINVISGDNGTGKSTLTWIVDYCLGSEKCSIPVGLIRELTGWFGMHLKLANTEMIIARRNPEDQQSTTDLYWNEGLKLEVPAIVQKNARVDDLKNRFNQIAHLPSLDFSTDDVVGYAGRPSSRDMAAFNFQPQHIVANPYTFFFKADTTEHREKLRIIFPLVLGSIDATTLAKQRELRDAEREYDKLRRELEARTTAARAWEAEVESYYLQAKGLGLLADAPSPGPGWGLDKYLLELRRVPDSVRQMDLPEVREGTNEAASGEFVRVAAEEDQLAQDTGSLKRRLDKIDQLSASLNDYGSSFTSQEDRLEGVGWLEEKLRDNHECPVCAAVHADGNARLTELQTLAREMKTLAVSVRQAPAKLDQEQATLRQELRDKETLLSRARQKRKFLEERTAAFAAQRQRVRQIYLFVGRVEQALENVMSSRNVDDLQDKARALAERLARLRKELDGKSRQDRLNAAIDKVSARIAYYAKSLRLEHATENVRLNTRELTLQFRPLSGRTDFLWEVGSGQNWVGYHLAGLLALHEHFNSLPKSPVPRFLMIDQPSQVYFPEAWPAMDQTPSGNKPSERSPDIEGVRRIFAALSEFMTVLKGQFQVIVTEHAGSITWQGIENVHLVANWREGQDDFLIPAEWQEKRT
jgi:energy-coupling factor transporter ATP-binding protein EcfA2